jgi:CxxC motif-containing protein
MHEIMALRLSPPVRMGDSVIADVCGTGVDVIATKTVD